MIQEDATASAETWSEWAWHLEELGKKKKKKATAHSSEFGLKGWSIQGWSHEKANDKLS